MIRYRCQLCGKTVEFLRSYGPVTETKSCSCGGSLLPINDSIFDLNKEEQDMKIAMPALNGQINPHFGTTREFAIVELENGKAKNTKIIDSEGMQHNHGGIAAMLKNESINVVIAGGMGSGMMEAMEQMGLKVVTGATGQLAEAAEAYAAGKLVTSQEGLCSCGGHH